jgi:uncharacterized protein (TIGR02757 family)
VELLRIESLRTALETLVIRYQVPSSLDADPLIIPLAYDDPWDREVAAWIAAHLAYGRVAPMLRAIRKVLAPMGPAPSRWLRSSSPARLRKALGTALQDWTWRFHTSGDMIEWVLAWKRLDAESHGQGMETHLLPRDGRSAEEAFSSLVQRLRQELPASYGTRFSLPDPKEGSACKRWRMFLRWMVRDGWPDLNQWRDYPKAALVIPLDTHVARTARLIGLSSRATPDGRMAQEITEALRTVDPSDPLRFDFALAHLGILGDCPGNRSIPGCSTCPLFSLCGAGVIKRKTSSPSLPRQRNNPYT